MVVGQETNGGGEIIIEKNDCRNLLLNFFSQSFVYFVMKRFLLLILFSLLCNHSFAKIPVEIELRKSNYKFFKIFLTTGYFEAIKINSLSFPITKEVYKDSLNFSEKNVLEVYYSKDGISWAKGANYFDINNTEKKIDIEIRFQKHTDNIDYCELRVFRYYESPAEIEIITEIDKTAGFKLINHSQNIYYGVNAFTYFEWDTFKLTNNVWEDYTFGSLLTSKGKASPFLPGDTMIAQNRDKINATGKFRDMIIFSTSEIPFFYYSLRPDEPPYNNIFDIYEIERFFEVK
jgi:hypothetical protein